MWRPRYEICSLFNFRMILEQSFFFIFFSWTKIVLVKKISATGKWLFLHAQNSFCRKRRFKNCRSLEWFLSLRQWSKQWLTFEEQNKNHRQLVDGLAQNVLHHGAGDERLGSAVRFSGQQILRRRSVASAKDANVSMIKFTHNICTARSGVS